MKKVELLDERDQMRERAEENAREQAELDTIGSLALASRDGLIRQTAVPRDVVQWPGSPRAIRVVALGLA